MKTQISLTVHLINEKARSFINIETFEIMQQGVLYVRTHPIMTIEQNSDKSTRRVKNNNKRYWIPLAQIKDIEVTTNHEISDPKECEKYDAFKKHGIDMTITPTSYTAPPNVEEVEKILNEEEGASHGN